MKKLKQFWADVPEGLKRIVHTFWQVAIPVLLGNLLLAKSSTEVKTSFILAGSTGLAAVKALLVNW